ncbi:MAG TPA: NlpC/P60 family protein, partial [Chitinophagaceae bacterium]|nr:NlpC/P60 family protein [Chitinophagaceae bacterium]
MLRKILPVFAILSVLASCSGIKPLAYTNNRQIPPATNDSKKEIKFLDISSANDDNKGSKSTIKEEQTSGPNPIASAESNFANNKTTEPAKFSSIQLKYAQLLNTEVEQVQNIQLYKAIDDWYGTRYRLGGTSKDGIDCSAFVQTIFVSVFAVTLPRLAKDQ